MSDSDEFLDAKSVSSDSFEVPLDAFNNSDGFFDVIEQQDKEETVKTDTRKRNELSILEFLQEEEEEIGEDEKNKMKDSSRKDLKKRETIFEFLAEENDPEETEKSESSLSRLQSELKEEADENVDHEKDDIVPDILPAENGGEAFRRTILNIPRRSESVTKRANPLASFFINNDDDDDRHSDSDSMISELTEALTIRTNSSETRLSRVPSMIQQADYLKSAKRYKPVPVKTKSKQKSEFTSLLLIQEINRSSRTEASGPTSPTPQTSSNIDPSKAIFVLKFSPDGHFLAAAGAEGIIKIWSLIRIPGEGTAVPRLAAIFENEPILVLRGHSAEILDCAWSSNNFLLSASMDKTVRLWHHSRPDALGIFQHLDYVTSVAFHPRDPRLFLSGSLDCKLRLWSIQERAILHWNELPPGNFITAVAFTRSGNTVIAGTSGGTALIFDTDHLRYNTQILVRSSRSKSVGKKITSIEAVPGHYDKDERVILFLFLSLVFILLLLF